MSHRGIYTSPIDWIELLDKKFTKNLATTAVYLDLIGKDIKEDFKKVEW